MRIYKETYTDKDGTKRQSKKWYIDFADNQQVRRRLPCFPSEKLTNKFAGKLEELLQSCGVVNRDLQKWLDGMRLDMKNRLIAWGLVGDNQQTKHLNKTLAEHLDDYIEGLKADKRSDAHIFQQRSSITRTMEGCGFKRWSDIDGNKVKTFLAAGRSDEGYGERAYNAYIVTFKTFCKWLVRNDRIIGKNPMDEAKPIKQTEFRHPRRALTVEEKERFLTTVAQSTKRYKNTGPERVLIYSLALKAGLRIDEIRQLRVQAFDFDRRIVRIEASECKGKHSDDLPLSADFAAALKEYFKNKQPNERAFRLVRPGGISDMVRADLAEAGIQYIDDAGRYCDFHALRHTFISHLALAGVHPTVCQKLARHADIQTTMRFYTHILHSSGVEGIDALENLSKACLGSAPKRRLAETSGEKNRIYGQKTA